LWELKHNGMSSIKKIHGFGLDTRHSIWDLWRTKWQEHTHKHTHTHTHTHKHVHLPPMLYNLSNWQRSRKTKTKKKTFSVAIVEFVMGENWRGKSLLSRHMEKKLQWWNKSWVRPTRGTPWCGWLRHCAKSWKDAGSIYDGVIGNFYWPNPSGRTMALGLIQPLTEISTTNISWGIKAAGA